MYNCICLQQQQRPYLITLSLATVSFHYSGWGFFLYFEKKYTGNDGVGVVPGVATLHVQHVINHVKAQWKLTQLYNCYPDPTCTCACECVCNEHKYVTKCSIYGHAATKLMLKVGYVGTYRLLHTSSNLYWLGFYTYYTHIPHTTHLDLGCHGNPIQWVYVGLSTHSIDKQLP